MQPRLLPHLPQPRLPHPQLPRQPLRHLPLHPLQQPRTPRSNRAPREKAGLKSGRLFFRLHDLALGSI